MFSNALVESYAKGVFLVVSNLGESDTKQDRLNDTQLAGRYGLEVGATIGRFRKAMKEAEKENLEQPDKGLLEFRLPTLKTIAHMNAARDVELPRGHHIALKAYVEVMMYFAEKAKTKVEHPITWQQVLCTCHAFRSRYFWKAIIEEPGSHTQIRAQKRAQQQIDAWIQQDLFDPDTTFDDVRNATFALRQIWPIIWSTLPDGWF